ncbi:MAG: hypothetical protein JSR24_00810 [Proteobacteria bacterium]|nr:hypothetical protein [Pseudomonadota bacterium]
MIGLFVAGFGMVLALAGDVAASRLGAGRVASYRASLFAGLCATALLLWMLPGIEWPTVAIALLTYATWWFIFLNLVQSLESSLRVKILGAIQAAGGHVSRPALATLYNDRKLLGLRLDRLRHGGAVVERGGRLHVVSPGLKTIAGLFRFLKMLLIGKTSEFGA